MNSTEHEPFLLGTDKCEEADVDDTSVQALRPHPLRLPKMVIIHVVLIILYTVIGSIIVHEAVNRCESTNHGIKDTPTCSSILTNMMDSIRGSFCEVQTSILHEVQ